jgi:predicted acylesterase/phospholipase RssA
MVNPDTARAALADLPPSGADRRSVLASMLLVGAAAGCSTPGRLPAVPNDLVAKADPGIGPVRFLVARDATPMEAEARRSLEKEIAHLQQTAGYAPGSPLPPVYMLAISGGGDDGAFGAGLLNGWTAHGDRPQFKFVTGVSTGALSAPFAFLGADYDPVLKAVYTGVSQKDIFKRRRIWSALFGDALSDTAPLHRLVNRYVDATLLQAIAAEYTKGRLLLVGTTNIDSLEPVIWNMTAIAANQDPRAPELFRKILLASSAIPGAFPPVLIDVQVDGKHYQEMHVDGGAMAQVFLYPPSIDIRRVGAPPRERKLYIIRNSRLDPDWASTRRRTLPIATRAISSLTQTQGIGDLYRIYLTSQRDGIDYNLAFVPRTFTTPHKAQFDPVYMSELYKTGYDMALAGYPWAKTPPLFGAPVKITPSEEARSDQQR